MKFDAKYNFYCLLFFCYLLLNVNSTIATDFTYFPEDNSISNDYIYTPGEIFYGSYYFSNSGIFLKDVRNGVIVSPTSDVRKIKNKLKIKSFNYSVY